MKLSTQSIRVLREIINEKSQYRSGPMLVQFFNALGFNDSYGQGFPSRWAYTEDKLNQLNGTATLDQCIKNVFSPMNYIETPGLLDELLELFNKYFQYDDWAVYIEGKNVLFRKVSFDLHQSFNPNAQAKKSAEEFLKVKISNLNISNLPIESCLYPIIESRLQEIDKCIVNHIPLGCIFLCGSVLEGILSAIAIKRPSEFNSAEASPKEKESDKVKRFEKWSLQNYISVAYELGYIKEDVKRFSHEVQNFRNYIHPYQQFSQSFYPTIDTALLCTQVVKMAINQIANRG